MLSVDDSPAVLSAYLLVVLHLTVPVVACVTHLRVVQDARICVVELSKILLLSADLAGDCSLFVHDVFSYELFFRCAPQWPSDGVAAGRANYKVSVAWIQVLVVVVGHELALAF